MNIDLCNRKASLTEVGNKKNVDFTADCSMAEDFKV